jgi:hypothetical protein
MIRPSALRQSDLNSDNYRDLRLIPSEQTQLDRAQLYKNGLEVLVIHLDSSLTWSPSLDQSSVKYNKTKSQFGSVPLWFSIGFK